MNHPVTRDVRESKAHSGQDRPDAVVATLDSAARHLRHPPSARALTWRVWGKGPPAVLFHGAHGSWTHWFHNIRHLAGLRQLFVPDLPGFGDSQWPETPDYADPALTDMIADAMAEVVPGGRLLDLIGFSVGGRLAAQVAARRPDRVRQLVLVGTAGLQLLPGPVIAPVKWRSLTDPDELRAAQRHNLRALMFEDPANIDDLAVFLQQRNAEQSRARPRRRTLENNIVPLLARFPGQVNAIWGSADNYAAAQIPERRALIEQAGPHVHTHVMAGGHWLMAESATQFNKWLSDLLRASAAPV